MQESVICTALPRTCMASARAALYRQLQEGDIYRRCCKQQTLVYSGTPHLQLGNSELATDGLNTEDPKVCTAFS